MILLLRAKSESFHQHEYHCCYVLCAPTSNWEDLTDVDPEQAEAARANKAQSLQVQQGGCILEALQASQLLHTQNQGGPAPVEDAQQGVKAFL